MIMIMLQKLACPMDLFANKSLDIFCRINSIKVASLLIEIEIKYLIQRSESGPCLTDFAAVQNETIVRSNDTITELNILFSGASLS